VRTPLRPMVVELAGPAGAGKSSLSRALTERAGTLPATMWKLPWSALLLRGLLLLPTFIALCRQSRALCWKEFKHIARLEVLERRLQKAAASQHRLIVLDEGPVFALSWLELFGHEAVRNGGAGAWRCQALRRWRRILDVVVLLDAPNPILAERIRSRTKPHPIKGKADREIQDFSARYRVAFDRTIADLRGNGGPTVLRCESDDAPVEQLAVLIAKQLRETCRAE
jgi:deoxyadenosine/deoxycytidine kinase